LAQAIPENTVTNAPYTLFVGLIPSAINAPAKPAVISFASRESSHSCIAGVYGFPFVLATGSATDLLDNTSVEDLSINALQVIIPANDTLSQNLACSCGFPEKHDARSVDACVAIAIAI